jgi:hypothetical protein
MKKSWTTGVETELARDIRANFSQSLVVRRRLAELLEAKAQESLKESRSKGNYASNIWAYLQADARGYERALQEVMELIKENDK